jgi:hypothetical protein
MQYIQVLGCQTSVQYCMMYICKHNKYYGSSAYVCVFKVGSLKPGGK